jgi:hypothetical protein
MRQRSYQTLLLKYFMAAAFFIISINCFSQRKSYYPLYLHYGGFGTHTIYRYEIAGKGRVAINDSAFEGDILITNNTVRITTEMVNRVINFSDQSLQSVTISNGLQELKLYRLKEYDNKLSRLIKDTLGIKNF